ncbi:MAG: transposase [Clostridia bacterium]|nr:transposase [Clostridia bacterium]
MSSESVSDIKNDNDEKLCKRKPTRLKGYDYSTPGAYFITVCTHNRKCLLSKIVGAIHESPENKLTQFGQIVKDIIEYLPQRFNIEINKYVIMPNHIHFIIVIKNYTQRAIHESPLQYHRSVISKVVGYLKMNASRQMHSTLAETKIWQRSFHDHIIRGEKDYRKIWEYIDTNVIKWEKDCFYT